MMENISMRTCQNCGSAKFKEWKELDDDEVFLIERLPAVSALSKEQRKRKLYCVRCFYPDLQKTGSSEDSA